MFSFPRDSAQFPLYVGGTMPGYWKLNTFAGYTKGYPDTFPDPGQPGASGRNRLPAGHPDRLLRVDQHLRLSAADRHDRRRRRVQHEGHRGSQLPARRRDVRLLAAAGRISHGRRDGPCLCAVAPRQQRLCPCQTTAAAPGRYTPGLVQPQNIADLPNIITAMGDVVHTDFPARPDRSAAFRGQPGQCQSHAAVRLRFSRLGSALASNTKQTDAPSSS